MKKIILACVMLLSVSITIQAQNERFGIKAGYSSAVLRVSVDGNSASQDVSGFYLGLFSEFGISEQFAIQPELQYASYSEDGESTDILIIPILAKYKADEKFSLLAGPQLDYLLNEEDSAGLTRLGLGLAIGASYDITDNLIIDARYSFGISNRIDDDELILSGTGAGDFDTAIGDFDLNARFNYLQVGLGYRF